MFMIFYRDHSLKKYLLIFLFLLVLGGGIIFLLHYLSPQGKQAREYTKKLGVLQQELQDKKVQSQKDRYGGKTPEETYQLFFQALKNNNINLASKYFILDKQKQYEQLFLSIQQNKEWEEMINDLSNSLNNSPGRYENKSNYLIQVLDKENNLITTIHLVLAPNSIWKIVEF